MNDRKIHRILTRNLTTLPNFLGVFPCNSLPEIRQYPCGFVLNLDSEGEKGSHWVGVFMPQPQFIWYFDSYGFGPNECVLDSLGNFTKFVRNAYMFQTRKSTCCGFYACYFIYKCSLGMHIEEIIGDLLSKLAKARRKGAVDKFVREFVNKQM